MVLCSFKIWLVQLVFTSINICLDAVIVTAQTIYPFTGNYRTNLNIHLISDNISQVLEINVSTAKWILKLFYLNSFSIYIQRLSRQRQLQNLVCNT
ncbi:hypothetical protein NLP_5006 [Nostoc sp. 'Lobaria pulmonaria (5183) cyanobiont']|nr:hypothetical protein NLP_5006 [Nostoc sp. 'Lobaria pulmonaria (5183) cyanobiont']